MLLLNVNPPVFRGGIRLISIHLMLLLNPLKLSVKQDLGTISIHLMLLLNLLLLQVIRKWLHFNTSYVVIKRYRSILLR